MAATGIAGRRPSAKRVVAVAVAAATILAVALTSAASAPEARAGGCTPGTVGCGWQAGDMVTYNQDNWGTSGTTASNLLIAHMVSAYPDGIEIGLVGAAGNSATFTTTDDVFAYLPATGPAGPFDNDRLDPTSTSAGVLGGYVLALKLDIDFADAGYLGGTPTLRFSDLRMCGLTSTPAFNGMTVREVLAALNGALGGGSTPYTYDGLAVVAEDLTQSFESGVPSQFAQEHLFNGACPDQAPVGADVGIVKTAPATVRRGYHIRYVLTVTNNGPDAAENVMVSDSLPAGLAGPVASSTKGTCSVGATISCDLGSLTSGETETVTIFAEVRAFHGTLKNTASVSSSTNDPNQANNSSTASTEIVP
jgi:uncharacterized repeat protein (TIGR01451 family)